VRRAWRAPEILASRQLASLWPWRAPDKVASRHDPFHAQWRAPYGLGVRHVKPWLDPLLK